MPATRSAYGVIDCSLIVCVARTAGSYKNKKAPPVGGAQKRKCRSVYAAWRRRKRRPAKPRPTSARLAGSGMGAVAAAKV